MDTQGSPGDVCKLEFAVQMTCEKCVHAVNSSLQGVKAASERSVRGRRWKRRQRQHGVCAIDTGRHTKDEGIQNVNVSLESEAVVVETTLPASEVQKLLESTGRRAVLKGMGSIRSQNLGAAVAMLAGAGSLQGVVHFLQTSENACIIDGTVDGLSPGLHGIHIHEFGDLSMGCERCGGHYNPEGSTHGSPEQPDSHIGDLGNILASDDGRATFRINSNRVKVWNIIGRSLVVDEEEDDLGCGTHHLSKVTGNSGKGLACGIIARSAGLFENPKQICSCDGITIWEERDCPIAGPERKKGHAASAHL